jgi:hypothetical protein
MASNGHPVRVRVRLPHICRKTLDAFRPGTTVVFKPFPGGLRGFVMAAASDQIESESSPIEKVHEGNLFLLHYLPLGVTIERKALTRGYLPN